MSKNKIRYFLYENLEFGDLQWLSRVRGIVSNSTTSAELLEFEYSRSVSNSTVFDKVLESTVLDKNNPSNISDISLIETLIITTLEEHLATYLRGNWVYLSFYRYCRKTSKLHHRGASRNRA